MIIIGGGAAGLFCAIDAGKRRRRVLVLEHNDRVGKKIAISGGGRCNFTNLGAGPDNYLSAQPDFCKSALARYTPWDFIALVQYPDNEAAFRALAKIGMLEVIKTETFPIEKVEVFFKTLV